MNPILFDGLIHIFPFKFVKSKDLFELGLPLITYDLGTVYREITYVMATLL